MRWFAAAFTLLLSGCALLPDGEDESPRNPKLECDQYASQAVQTDDLQTAKNLAARASECYAAVQQNPRN